MDSRQGSDTTVNEGDCFARNLAALRRLQPALATRLQSTAIPGHAERVTGRDGTPNYLIRGDDGRREWFGGSSMPTISAPAMVEQANTPKGNVLLPAVATGLEAKLLVEKVAAHCAVFVYEHNLAALRMALTLQDVSEPVAAGRLVLLGGDEVEAALVAFFREHVGYEFPSRILPPTGFLPDRVGAVKAAVESAGRTIAARQIVAVDEVAAELRSRQSFALAPSPRVVVLSVDPRPDTLEFAGRIERTLDSLGWPAASCLPQSPQRCHTLARLSAIRDHRADLLLTVNSCGGRIEPFISGRQPIASWYGPTGQVPPGLGDDGPHHGLHLAATPAQRDQLVAGGVPEERAAVLEVGADALSFSVLDADRPEVRLHKCDVAVLGDVPDARPQASVSAESHIRLFKAILRSAPAWAENYTPQQADAILARAERQCDRPLKEERIRAGFLAMIRRTIAPAVISRMAVERLVKAGISIRVWGRGWQASGVRPPVLQGPVPSAETRNGIYNAAGVVLCPFATAVTVQTMLEVLTGGGRVYHRRPDRPIHELHPQLGDTLQTLPSYHRLTELDRAISGFLSDTDADTSPFAEARREILAGHTLAHRLESIRRHAEAFFA
ncbi:MAG: hypothetical protein JSV19_11140 [Phycisphaerales bacterium]|nr:MAG: hypothetical protein JSV19_11140 [Phycisphaerales bacterium]